MSGVQGKTGGMETPRESGAGYPEEEPAEVAEGDTPSGTPQRDAATPSEGGRHGEGGSPATENDDGTATGNPNPV